MELGMSGPNGVRVQKRADLEFVRELDCVIIQNRVAMVCHVKVQMRTWKCAILIHVFLVSL